MPYRVLVDRQVTDFGIAHQLDPVDEQIAYSLPSAFYGVICGYFFMLFVQCHQNQKSVFVSAFVAVFIAIFF